MSYCTGAQSNIAKVDLFSLQVNLNTNFLASDVKATIQPASIWLIYMTTASPAQLQVVRTQIATNNTITEKFPITVSAQPSWYNILVSFGETINFQLSASTSLLRFNVSEIVPFTSHMGA